MKIFPKGNQQIFFTSDSHYDHRNICRVTSNWPEDSYTRDFPGVKAMNDRLVQEINDKVGEDDILFHLGDMAFQPDMVKQFRNRINCKNIHWILGNHDWRVKKNPKPFLDMFSSMSEYKYVMIYLDGEEDEDPVKLVLCHYPISSWQGMCGGTIHLHGHLHCLEHDKMGKGMTLDVGVDGNDYKPYSLDEVLALMIDKDPCEPFTHPSVR